MFPDIHSANDNFFKPLESCKFFSCSKSCMKHSTMVNNIIFHLGNPPPSVDDLYLAPHEIGPGPNPYDTIGKASGVYMELDAISYDSFMTDEDSAVADNDYNEGKLGGGGYENMIGDRTASQVSKEKGYKGNRTSARNSTTNPYNYNTVIKIP